MASFTSLPLVVSQERAYKAIGVVDQIAVHFVLENSLEYQDSSEDENSNAEEDQPDGWLSLKHVPKRIKSSTQTCSSAPAQLLMMSPCTRGDGFGVVCARLQRVSL